MPGDATPRGPLGDARPDAQERPAAPTPGSLKPEKVENRDNVGTARPEDYPEDFDADPQGGGGQAPIPADRGPKEGADAPIGGSR